MEIDLGVNVLVCCLINLFVLISHDKLHSCCMLKKYAIYVYIKKKKKKVRKGGG